MDPSGCVVWITGASSGIGEATALALADAGARLVLSARRAGRLEAVRERCPDPSRVALLPLDVGDPEARRGAAEAAASFFGPPDVLVLNAGISQRALALEADPEVDRRVMEVNFFGATELARGAVPAMVRRGRGQVVVVSSVVAYLATPRRSAYAASKRALHGWFDALRAEVHDAGVRVTLVVPGYVRTAISQAALDATGAPHGRLDPGQARGIPPERVAARILAAIRRPRREVLVGGPEVLAVPLARLLPGLAAWLVRRLPTT